MKTFELNNGVLMPVFGLGTFPMKRYELFKTVLESVLQGYIMFDTAAAYKNEKALGYAINFCMKKRNKLFITTKLSNAQQNKGDVRHALSESLKLLGLKYVDLYLMHWPNPNTYLSSWKQMEQLYKEGLCRAIGVCNFHQHHIEEILSVADVIPAINQIELHPLLSQKPLIKYCNSKGIVIEAYSPLARMDSKLIQNNELIQLSQKYGKTVVQLILRWNYQNSIITIPKTSNRNRLKSNINIFDFHISLEDMKLIDELNVDYRVRHNPDACDFSRL